MPASVTPSLPSISPDSRFPTDRITDVHDITVTGTAGDNASVTLGGGAGDLGTATADASGNWSMALNLADGNYQVHVSGNDGGGASTSNTADFVIIIDTVAPTTPTLAASNANGAVADGATISGANLTLSGTEEAFTEVDVFDGATSIGSTFSDPSGNWSFTVSGQSGGGHTYTTQAIDLAGNQSAVSGSLSVTVDNTPPAAALISGITPDTGTSASDGITSAGALTISGSAEANSSLTLKDGSTVIGTVAVDGSGAWSVAASLAEGTHSLTAAATDAVGNVGPASSAFSVTVDTTAPGTPSIAGFTPDTGTSATDSVTGTGHVTITGSAEANAIVALTDGVTSLGNATADGSGAWSFGADLADGSHSITAEANDAAGNSSAASAALAITVDSVAPGSPSVGAVDQLGHAVTDGGSSTATALTLSGSAEANSSVVIKEGATVLGTVAADGSGAWSLAVASPSEATHDYAVTATDRAGNVSAAGTFDVTIDRTAPSTPSIAAIAPDSGVSATDHLTDSGTITVSGSADANVTLTLSDGASVLGTTTADGTGAWSFAAGLAEGSHNLTAIAQDGAGNSSGASAGFALTIDTTAPAAPHISGIAPDSGASGTDATTDTGGLTINGTAEANASVAILDGGGSLGTVTANGSGNWSLVTSLGSGSHSLTATATDRAGNTGAASSALVVTVDTAPPAAPSFTATDDHGATITEGETVATGSLAFTGTAEANAAVTLKDGGTTLATVTADGSGAWSFTDSGVSSAGHAFTAIAADLAGNNSGSSAALDVTVNNAAPGTPSILSLTPDTGISATDHITSATNLTLTGAAEANATVAINEGAAALGSVTADGSGNWSFAGSFAEGSHSLTAQATNTLGVVSPVSTSFTVTVDETAPAAPAITGFTPDSGASSSDHLTNAASLTVSGTAEANSQVTVSDGATVLGTANTNGGGAWSFVAGSLGEGAHSLTAVATDSAGNTGTASTALGLTIDRTAPAAPSLTATDDMGHGVASGAMLADGSLTLSGMTEAGDSLSIKDGSTVLGTATADGSGVWSFSANLGAGSHSLAAAAIDLAGNAGADSASIAVTVPAPAGGGGGGGGGGGTPPTNPPPQGNPFDFSGATGAVDLVGTAGNDSMAGGTGNDTFRGSGGDDTIVGGAGVNTALYSGNRADYSISTANGITIVTDNSGHDGTDTLSQVQTLKFADTSVNLAAFDVVRIGQAGSGGEAGFDSPFYLSANPDVLAAGIDPQQHYDQYGWHEGRNPNPFFDTLFYLANNPDVAASGMNPYLHYEEFGWREGRDPSANFSTNTYLADNPDVKLAGLNPVDHFLMFGVAEGRIL